MELYTCSKILELGFFEAYRYASKRAKAYRAVYIRHHESTPIDTNWNETDWQKNGWQKNDGRFTERRNPANRHELTRIRTSGVSFHSKRRCVPLRRDHVRVARSWGNCLCVFFRRVRPQASLLLLGLGFPRLQSLQVRCRLLVRGQIRSHTLGLCQALGYQNLV